MDLLSISAVNWARGQFALTAGYHWIFVPLTIGLALIIVAVVGRAWCSLYIGGRKAAELVTAGAGEVVASPEALRAILA